MFYCQLRVGCRHFVLLKSCRHKWCAATKTEQCQPSTTGQNKITDTRWWNCVFPFSSVEKEYYVSKSALLYSMGILLLAMTSPKQKSSQGINHRLAGIITTGETRKSSLLRLISLFIIRGSLPLWLQPRNELEWKQTTLCLETPRGAVLSYQPVFQQT